MHSSDPTHEVFNQSSPFSGRNLFDADPALRDALGALAPSQPLDALRVQGARWGSSEWQEHARLANENPPALVSFDRAGRRVDELQFHPSWHLLMRELIGSGVHSEPWARPVAAAQVLRAASYYLYGQLENGTQCPATMTFAVVPVIARHRELAQQWLPKLLSRDYDQRSVPMESKRGVLMGMGMTEKQGGSDLRTNTTRAVAVGRSAWGEQYRITGHKWFFSAPQCDAHLVLAKASGERLTCFFLPRFLPDGVRNGILVQRLKNKVGNRSNASSEVEFVDACAWRVGEEGRGVATILEMGNHTRLDCAIGAAGIMRHALTLALHHARERSAFGRLLAEQALMRSVLAEIALESEAAMWLALRLARSYDCDADERELMLRRVLTPVAKYWICKRAPVVVAEAMEVLGGNGYVEESPIGRLFRESPLNSIWEGSGNVIALDMLRALSGSSGIREALAHELAAARGADARYDRACDDVLAWLGASLDDESLARTRAEQLALLLQIALLLRHAPPAVSAAFVAARLDTPWRGALGTLPRGVDTEALLDRALPR
jgi:putative acyl-CoA dehydrogenase